jgi:hypothetical protein
MGKLRKDVRLSCRVWKARDVELAGVSGLNFCFVGQLDVNSLVGGDLLAAWVGNV